MLPCSLPCLPSNDLQGERAQGYHRQEASREAPKEGALVGGGEAHIAMLLRFICPSLSLSASLSLPVFSFSIRLPFWPHLFFLFCVPMMHKRSRNVGLIQGKMASTGKAKRNGRSAKASSNAPSCSRHVQVPPSAPFLLTFFSLLPSEHWRKREFPAHA